VLKRSASAEPEVKTEGGNEAKRCKVEVKEETINGLVVFEIKDEDSD
jgi:hypothetical protein